MFLRKYGEEKNRKRHSWRSSQSQIAECYVKLSGSRSFVNATLQGLLYISRRDTYKCLCIAIHNHFHGAYANRVRSSMPHGRNSEQNKGQGEEDEEPAPAKRAVRKRWAELIYKIYNVDPLTCQCGAQMKIVAFVTEPASIRRILAHRKNNSSRQRAPPNPTLNLH